MVKSPWRMLVARDILKQNSYRLNQPFADHNNRFPYPFACFMLSCLLSCFHAFMLSCLCPQLVVKTKYIDTLIKLLLTYLLTYLLTSTSETPTFSYTWRLKKVALSDRAYQYRPLWGAPPGRITAPHCMGRKSIEGLPPAVHRRHPFIQLGKKRQKWPVQTFFSKEQLNGKAWA